MMGLLGDIVGGVEGAVNSVESFLSSAQQQQNQQTTWAREDNAVQRRVADLKAAGLSPTLAAGSAASSSAPIAVMTPRSDIVGSVGKAQDISRSTAEQYLTEKQEDIAVQQQQKAKADQWLANRDVDIANKVDGLFGGRDGVAALSRNNMIANSNANSAAAARASYDANLSGMRSSWYARNGLPPGDVPGDVMSALSRASVLGLQDKDAVGIGAFWDVLSKLGPPLLAK